MLQTELESQMIAVFNEVNELDITVTRIVQSPHQKTPQMVMRWVKNEQGDLTCQWCLE